MMSGAQITFTLLVVSVSMGIFSIFRQNEPCEVSKPLLSFWLINSSNTNPEDGLRVVKKVLNHVGHGVVNGSVDDWDVMWSIDFPFESFPEKLLGLKRRTLINHFPAITFLTNKMFLSMHTESKYIPVAFEFPRFKNEFLYHHRLNPDKKYLMKHFNEGGMKIVPFDEIDYFLGSEHYLQEFISNPYLIDGRAFDIGVFVLITSIEPLRIYRFKSDIMLRFCSEKFHPFDHENVGKYVVDKFSHEPFWEIPSLKNATQTFGFSAFKALNYHLKEQKEDFESIWDQIDDAIVSITVSKAEQITRHVNLFNKKNSGQKPKFFELLRYDFVVDEKLNLHLLEIDMNPDLEALSLKHERYNLFYQELVYNTFAILGITNRNELKPDTIEESQMFSAPKDIAVNPDECSKCIHSCNDPSCELCLPCLSTETLDAFHQAYREHQRRGEMERLFPSDDLLGESVVKKLSAANKLSMEWFNAKCNEDYDWC